MWSVSARREVGWGRRVAYTSLRCLPGEGQGPSLCGRRVWVVEDDGRNAHPITRALRGAVPYGLSFTADGSAVLFQRIVENGIGYNTPSQLWVAAVGGGGEVPVSGRLGSGSGPYVEDPVISADGRPVVFSAVEQPFSAAGADLYALQLGSPGVRRLTVTPELEVH